MAYQRRKRRFDRKKVVLVERTEGNERRINSGIESIVGMWYYVTGG